MSESRPSLYPRATWLLLAGLIGVCTLGWWYVGSLRQTLDATTLRLTDTDQRLSAVTAAEQGLRTQLAAAQEQLQSTTERHETAAAQIAQYKQDLAAAAGREQGLTARLAASGAEHEGQLAALNQAMAEADAKWAEKLRVYRTALEGTEPQRAALMNRLEQRATEEHAALEQEAERHRAQSEQAEQARQAGETQLTDRLTQAQRQLDEAAQALAAAAADKAAQEGLLAEANGKVFALTEEVQSQRDELAALGQKYEATLAEQRAERDQAAATLAGVQAELGSAITAAAEARQAQEAQRKAAELRISQLEEDLKTAQSSYEQTLTAAELKVEQTRVAAQEQADLTLAAELAKAEQARAQLQQRADAALAAERDKVAQALAAERQAKTAAVTQTRGLLARYAELKAQPTQRGALINLGDDQLHFATGGAALPKGQVASLDRIGALLGDYPHLSVRIEGYTDNSGADDANLALSQARADAVRQGLIDRGVAPERLTAEGFGKQRPIADNATAPGRRKNRRVEVYLIEPAP